MSKEYFLQEIKELIPDKYDLFLQSEEVEMKKAIRINPLKADEQLISKQFPLGKKTSFDSDTYLLDSEEKLGKHPYHMAGCYYLQEPSATMAVSALQVQQNDMVLDLCAAPGGKSTQILSKLNNTGFLFTNEYDKKRANTLLSNIERWSCDNYLLTNSTVENLCPQLSGNFDRVLVDAPCSGASMFKKYPDTINDYNESSVLACAKRQLHILDYAYMALKQSGRLVYSTCTYNRSENEDVVSQFLINHPDMELVDTGLSCGSKGFDPQGLTRRCWPFEEGEGHFVAAFVKNGESAVKKIKRINYSSNKIVDAFLKENCLEKHNYTVIKDKVYLSSDNLYDVNGFVLRQGILLGEIVKNRIEPAHHFFISLNDFKNVYNITDEKQIAIYLSGQSLMVAGYKGYVQICYNGVPIGFGKGDNQQIKNHFPKGLRISI